MKNKALITIPMVPIFVNVPKKQFPTITYLAKAIFGILGS
jgi:hypothetical protein